MFLYNIVLYLCLQSLIPSKTKLSNVQIQILVCFIPSLFLLCHHTLSSPTVPHTRKLHHCIPSPLRTNQRCFRCLTPLSFHSACHSPLLTHTLRETHWPSMPELPDLPPSHHSHTYTLILFHTCTPLGEAERYVRLGVWGLERGPGGGCSTMQTTVPKPTMPSSQAERSGLHTARQNTRCSSPSGMSWSQHKTEDWDGRWSGLKCILGISLREKGWGGCIA